MANYTTADVKRIRELTGSGMMDCKKALEQADGDLEKAVELLRIKGAKDVGKRAERATSNGLVVASGGTMVELDCETDFVAKSTDFQSLADQILQVALREKPTDLDALRAAPLGEGTVDQAVAALSARIGEKLELKRYIAIDGPVALYLHRRSTDLPPVIGSLVSYEGADADAARGVAMHIAAARPRYTRRDQVPTDVLENERRIAEATAREEGKPEQVLTRIVEGRVNGYYKDVVLLEQASVQDPKKTVKALLDEAGVTVKEFVRFEVGQGLTPVAAIPIDAGEVRPGFRRVLLKLGGEMFGGGAVGVDPTVVDAVARQIAEVVATGAQIAVVIGGGNFFRGAELQQRGMERSRADYMGMLGTVMNCLALQDFLEREHHIDTRVQTAITMGQVAEAYIPRRAIRHLEKGRVVIFGAGVGMPYFSTDTAGAQRALEVGAEVLLLAKSVDGVYTADPKVDPDAKMYDEITHREALEQGLAVADATAFSLCMDNRMPIIVFNLLTEGNIARAVAGERIGTLVSTPEPGPHSKEQP